MVPSMAVEAIQVTAAAVTRAMVVALAAGQATAKEPAVAQTMIAPMTLRVSVASVVEVRAAVQLLHRLAAGRATVKVPAAARMTIVLMPLSAPTDSAMLTKHRLHASSEPGCLLMVLSRCAYVKIRKLMYILYLLSVNRMAVLI